MAAKLFLLACLLGIALAQTKPQISEVFQARVHLTFRDLHNNMTHRGDGLWAANQPKGESVEMIHIVSGHPFNAFFLMRYDEHMGYDIETRNGTCHKHSLSGDMPLTWGWIAQSTFKGKRNMRGQTFDIWQNTVGHASLTVLVNEKNVNVPVVLTRTTPDREVTYDFWNWNTTVNEHFFEVPKSCQSVEAEEQVGCVSRSSMIQRAQVWVDKHVPYNQGGTYDGYREDCSGYVSMAWQLSKPGLTTRTLPSVSHRIGKDDLQPGDVLLNTAEHVVLFGGWADSSKSHYTAYEETRPGEGTVKRVTPYPYWYNTNAFLPYRFNSVC